MAKKFTLTIDCGNDVFQPDPTREIVHILRTVAGWMERSNQDDGHVYDSNGNTVGKYALKGKP